MNNQPHTHEVQVTDYSTWWCVRYGDQTAFPNKPVLFPGRRGAPKLRRTIDQLIRDHDEASRRAPGTDVDPVITAAIPTLRSDRWGDEQLEASHG